MEGKRKGLVEIDKRREINRGGDRKQKKVRD
jgi:hypothetical protein